MGMSQKLCNFVKVESPTPRNPAGTIEWPRFRSHAGQSHSFWESVIPSLPLFGRKALWRAFQGGALGL